MKKFLAIVLSLCLMVTLLCSCGQTENPSSDNSSANKETVNVADFEGIWEIDNANAKIVKIDSAASTVTAYAENGIAIGTFAVKATDEGIVLKMGAFGEVTLKDATSLKITTVPAVSLPSITGKWDYVFGDLPDDTLLDITSENRFVINGSQADYGNYEIRDNIISLSPTHELSGAISHVLAGGGDVLNATTPTVRYYVRESAMSTDTGKALYNYYKMFANKWAVSGDDTFTLEFKDNGTFNVAGTTSGIWYPTANGAGVEYLDGTKEDITVSNDAITLNYYAKTFNKKIG